MARNVIETQNTWEGEASDTFMRVLDPYIPMSQPKIYIRHEKRTCLK